MSDYIYLLENRLSPAQQNAVRLVREAARDQGMTVFLTGGAVRDLTSGSSVRDLDFSVQGNALTLREPLVEAGATFWGEHTPSQTLFFRFPGSLRVEISSTRREEFPKPGKPVYQWDTILEDLRRRDFTANAMAVSLNEGSYGLLMDPTNGAADIEQRILRLVNNYGFLEDPIRLVRATRFSARLGWQMDERTQTRFENAREEGVIGAISAWQKGYESEEIGHEENPLEVLKAMEAAGWMKVLCPAWTPSRADVQGIEQMHELLMRLQMQGIYPDASAAAMELLTAKMQPKDVEALKKSFVRPGFVAEWNRLDADAREFERELTAKDANAPSATWKLFMRARPEAVLWLGLTGKNAAVQNKFKNFFNVWPAARQKTPTALMQEMRITPEIERYSELLDELFYRTIDNQLETEEQMRAFLEPYSPPAPPPPVTVRRSRAKKAAEKRQPAEVEVVEEGETLTDLVQAPGQEKDQIAVSRVDTPAVGETAPPSETPVVGIKAKDTAPKKKARPAGKLAPVEAPTPVQAASRLAGQQLADLGTPAPMAKAPARKAAASAPPKAAQAAAAPLASTGSAKKAAGKAVGAAAKVAGKPSAKTSAKAPGKPAPARAAVVPAKAASKPAPAAAKSSAAAKKSFRPSAGKGVPQGQQSSIGKALSKRTAKGKSAQKSSARVAAGSSGARKR